MAAAATLAMFAGSASAGVDVHGQLNRMVSFTNDGHQSNALFLDNDFSPSMFGMSANYAVDKCTAMGGVLDITTSPNNSRLISQIRNADIGYNFAYVRRADVWVSYGKLGRLSVGYGDAASYGITRMSYSNTGETVSSAQISNLAGGMLFHPKNGNVSGLPANGADGTVDGGMPGNLPTIAQAFNSLDGIGSIFDNTDLYRQKNRVRWDSCEWCGFMLSVSHGSVQPYYLAGRNGQDQDMTPFRHWSTTRTFTDAALRYEGNWCDFMFSGAVAWAQISHDWYNGFQSEAIARPAGADVPNNTDVWTNSATADRRLRLWAGSVAAEHKCTGINVAASYGNLRKMASSLNNTKTWFVQVGKHNCWMPYGQTDLVVDYTYGKDTLINQDKSKSFGVGVVQHVDKANSQVYATYRYHKYDLPGAATLVAQGNTNTFGNNTVTEFDTINVISVGVLFKFGAML